MSLGFDLVPGTDIWVAPPALEQEIIRNPNGVPQLDTENHQFTKTDDIIHGRCYNDPNLLVFRNSSITDEFGLVYFALSIKGMDLTRPHASYEPVGNFVIRVNGALEAETFYRCRKASELMRREGILTEYVFYQARPLQFPNGKENSSKTNLQGFRSRLHREYIANQIEFDDFDSPEVSEAVIKSIYGSKFGVAYRGMLSNVRLGEIKFLKEKRELEHHLAHAILALQLRRPEQFECWPDIERLNPYNKEDQYLYLEEILPRLIGENLAKFHNAGFYHKYLHENNVTLCGEIVDTDSIRHIEIDPDDEFEINFATRFSDFRKIFYQYSLLWDHFNNVQYTRSKPNWLSESYFTHRDKLKHYEPIEQLFEEIHFDCIARPISIQTPPSVIAIPHKVIKECRSLISETFTTNASQMEPQIIKKLIDNLTLLIGVKASLNKNVLRNEYTAPFFTSHLHDRVLEIESRRYAFTLVQQAWRKYSLKMSNKADVSGIV